MCMTWLLVTQIHTYKHNTTQQFINLTVCDDGFGSLGWFESVSCEFNQILCEFNAINQMTRPEMLCNYTFMWCAVS